MSGKGLEIPFPETESSSERERKSTAIAPANIALIKYWGKRGDNLPYTDTISFNLSDCFTTTTVSFNPELEKDEVLIDGQVVRGNRSGRVIGLIDFIRKIRGTSLRARVMSRNSFPSGVGIASSASAFSALALSASVALDIDLSPRELSSIARLGSGSASRSIPDGFVLWHRGENHESSFAESIYPPDHWDLRDFVLVVSKKEKDISSAEGHKIAHTSPYFEQRVRSLVPRRIEKVLDALRNRNIELLGETIEEEARELHKIAGTSSPPIIYATSETWHIADKTLPRWRKDGIPAYFTLDAGPNVHVIVPAEYVEKVRQRLAEDLPGISYIENHPAKGAMVIDSHLF